jgi:hypothetical protein
MRHAIINYQGLSACGTGGYRCLHTLGGSAIVGYSDVVLASDFKDSTAVSLWDAHTAPAK